MLIFRISRRRSRTKVVQNNPLVGLLHHFANTLYKLAHFQLKQDIPMCICRCSVMWLEMIIISHDAGASGGECQRPDSRSRSATHDRPRYATDPINNIPIYTVNVPDISHKYMRTFHFLTTQMTAHKSAHIRRLRILVINSMRVCAGARKWVASSNMELGVR